MLRTKGPTKYVSEAFRGGGVKIDNPFHTIIQLSLQEQEQNDVYL